MIKFKDKLLQLRKTKKAILATNFYNLETLKGILMAASEARLPVVLQLSKGSIEYFGLKTAVKMARQGLEDYQVEGWLHLDHGDSVDLVKRCLDAGFDSVMIDASESEFEKNVFITSKVVELAKYYDVPVEAELGYVAKLGQGQTGHGFTQPDEATRFVEQTSIDSLAIAIGSAHGFYTEEPNLRIDILQQISEMVPAALVLHGSSGIPPEKLKEALKNGINKVNLATEIKYAFVAALRDQLRITTEIDLRKLFPPAIQSVTDLVKSKLLLLDEINSL